MYTHTYPNIFVYHTTKCTHLALYQYTLQTQFTSLLPLAQKTQLPLHLALGCNAGPEVVEALLLAYPDAAGKPDEVRCGGDMGCYLCDVFLCYVPGVSLCVHTCLCVYTNTHSHTHAHIYIYVYVTYDAHSKIGMDTS